MASTSAYPPPPPYYKLYKDFLENPDSAPAPPPVIEGMYTMFGSTYTTDDLLPSLEDQGLRQLYPKGPNIDYKKELKALNRELLLQVLELIDVLVERPSQYARRVEDVALIFRNLHHLLNSLRPHQARATLIHILEMQIQRRKQAVEDIRRYKIIACRRQSRVQICLKTCKEICSDLKILYISGGERKQGFCFKNH
ncbi:hypothetical protein O6H91_16G079500 [Diphasiastrum complanatum]|uniref:Uncharacterized protein n=1 Tax=Diphasiastrum complanatum TaxID=34168 RepID=A0ACC2BE22_DIPCM|nr:hypothetical protein O6H91_16G079500 [Diphasiastrum complanatum]